MPDRSSHPDPPAHATKPDGTVNNPSYHHLPGHRPRVRRTPQPSLRRPCLLSLSLSPMSPGAFIRALPAPPQAHPGRPDTPCATSPAYPPPSQPTENSIAGCADPPRQSNRAFASASDAKTLNSFSQLAGNLVPETVSLDSEVSDSGRSIPSYPVSLSVVDQPAPSAGAGADTTDATGALVLCRGDCAWRGIDAGTDLSWSLPHRWPQ